MHKKVKLLHNGQKISANYNPELVFRRALTIAKARGDVSMDFIMSQPITSVPTSIFHEDGTMRKTKPNCWENWRKVLRACKDYQRIMIFRTLSTFVMLWLPSRP